MCSKTIKHIAKLFLQSADNIPYSGKLLREKNFCGLWLFAKVFSAKFGGVASFGTAKASNLRKFSPSKVSHYTVVYLGESSPLVFLQNAVSSSCEVAGGLWEAQRHS